MDVIEMNKLEDILSAVEYNGRGIETLKTDMTTVKANTSTLLSKSVVKSVQRGMVECSSTVNDSLSETLTVNIASINPEKAVVIYTTSVSDNRPAGGVSVSELTLTNDTITFKVHGADINWSTPVVLWQVVEFY